MALECIKGTTVPIVDVVKKARQNFKDSHARREPRGMCSFFVGALHDLGATDGDVWFWEIPAFIPLFSRSLAKALFSAPAEDSDYWWPVECPTKRLEYFDWLIEQYSKEI